MSNDQPSIPAPSKSMARRTMRWAMVVVFALAAALWIDFARQALAADRVQWQELASPADFTAFVAPDASSNPRIIDAGSAPLPASAAEARPRLIYFTADWCGPCRLLKADVFSKTQVADAIHERFMPFVVDQTRPTPQQLDLATAYQVYSVPTLLIVDGRGVLLSRLDRVVDAPAFLEWLDTGWKRWDQAEPSEPRPASIISLNQPSQ